MDANHQGVSIDVNAEKRFKPFVNLGNLPINECLNSKIKTDHRFNYDTESARLPTNNPEYNAALYDWQKYTKDASGSSVLDSMGAYIDPSYQGVKALAAGPPKVKQTFQEVTLKMGENESMGGSSDDDSDSGSALKCSDEKGGCRVYMIFQPDREGVNLLADVVPT